MSSSGGQGFGVGLGSGGGGIGVGAEEQAALFRAAFEAAPIAMAITDADGRYVMVNRALGELVGQSEAELIGAQFQARVHPDDLGGEMAQLERLRSLEISCYEAEGRRIHPERGVVWIRERVSVALDADDSPSIANDDGLPRYVIRQLVDVTAEREAQALVEEAHRQAVAANEAKTEFLSRMSHELRTPLNAILGFAQILELEQLTPSQTDALAHIIKGGRHLLNLINEVLDIARIESGSLALSPEPVPMAQAVNEALDLLRPFAAAQGITLDLDRLDQGQCPDSIVAELSRLKQVLLNLVSNAIKYNRPGGSVKVTCEVVREGWGRISVTDTGTGIPADLLPELFTPFHRLGAEHSGVEGTGVGLALSRRLTEAMGGVLSLDTVPGEGTTFWVQLPLADRAPGHLQDPASAGHSAADPDATNRARILYIEDNLSNLRLMERIFEHTELISAMQGELGLLLARQHHPDLVLLDLHLPDFSGEEVLRRLRADPATAQLPVVIVSADATAGQIRRLLACGAQAYLTKPLDVHEVRQVVDELLQAHAVQQHSEAAQH